MINTHKLNLPLSRTYFHCSKCDQAIEVILYIEGWSGGAMVLGKLPVSGHSSMLIIVGQGPHVLAVGAGGWLFGHFYSRLSFLFYYSLFGRRPDID